ncbi:hypothetical protein F383_38224 [Gossypium arboreum]|uniref:Uncharacterized protein n=1 Tax=Gossypium arboreum TaxID=29729 RepID=A0A0B0MFA7_GOSAR|nr:hypothetical protein F383_38224 [Gossypium arboreum]
MTSLILSFITIQ